MTAYRPRDLPRVRAELAESLEQLLARLSPAERAVEQARIDAIRHSPLWWVSPDMTALALEASRSLPAWSPRGAAPGTTGILLWAGQMPTAPFDGAHTDTWTRTAFGTLQPPEVPIRGVQWRVTPDAIEIYSVVRRDDLPAGAWRIPVAGTVPSTGVHLESEVLTSPIVDEEGGPLGVDRSWMDSFVAMVGATWRLMVEPAVTDDVVRPARAGRRRSPRGPVTVRVVDLHAATPRQPAAPEARATWHLTARHLVRGHWRMQPVGPGRTQREPRWIAAHLRGPDGTPLAPSPDVVRTWTRRPPT